MHSKTISCIMEQLNIYLTPEKVTYVIVCQSVLGAHERSRQILFNFQPPSISRVLQPTSSDDETNEAITKSQRP